MPLKSDHLFSSTTIFCLRFKQQRKTAADVPCKQPKMTKNRVKAAAHHFGPASTHPRRIGSKCDVARWKMKPSCTIRSQNSTLGCPKVVYYIPLNEVPKIARNSGCVKSSKKFFLNTLCGRRSKLNSFREIVMGNGTKHHRIRMEKCVWDTSLSHCYFLHFWQKKNDHVESIFFKKKNNHHPSLITSMLIIIIFVTSRIELSINFVRPICGVILVWMPPFKLTCATKKEKSFEMPERSNKVENWG